MQQQQQQGFSLSALQKWAKITMKAYFTELTHRDIADRIKFSLSQVLYIWNKYLKKGSVDDLKSQNINRKSLIEDEQVQEEVKNRLQQYKNTQQLTPSLTGEQNITIQEDLMIPKSHRIIGEQFTFQEDNDPKHGGDRGCLIVKNYIQNKNINRLQWPSQSPDMKPIEHAWAEIKYQLRASNIKDKADLIEKFYSIWVQIDNEFLDKLIRSMPNRVKELKKAKGGYTHY